MTELKTIPHPTPLRCPECSSERLTVQVTRRYPDSENPTRTVRWFHCEGCERTTFKTEELHGGGKN